MSFKRRFILLATYSITVILSSPIFLMAAGGGKSEGALTQKISTDNLTGLSLWLVNLYNQDPRIGFAILATVTMGLIGVAIAFLTDLILKMLGLEVSKISHHE